MVKVKKVNSTNGPLEQPRKVGGMCSREESAYLFYKAGNTGWNQHKHAGRKHEQRRCFTVFLTCTEFVHKDPAARHNVMY